MKNTIRFLSTTAFLAQLTATPALRAQEPEAAVTTVQTTTSAGVISNFGPKTFFIRTEASPDPVSYSYTKTTSYVDETGAPVSMETVKSGLPVTVYYVHNGDQMVASKVIVRKSVKVITPAVEVAPEAPVVEEKKTTTTTTTTTETTGK